MAAGALLEFERKMRTFYYMMHDGPLNSLEDGGSIFVSTPSSGPQIGNAGEHKGSENTWSSLDRTATVDVVHGDFGGGTCGLKRSRSHVSTVQRRVVRYT
jgi:hypothetical protein